MKTLVLYHTKTGHTLEAINAVISGIHAAGGETEVVLANDFETQMVLECDALIVASPCWGGSSGIIGVAKPLLEILKILPNDSLKGKKIGGVAVHAKYGGESTLKQIEKLTARKGGENFHPAPVIKAGVLMSLYKGPSVKDVDEERLKSYGVAFASNGIHS